MTAQHDRCGDFYIACFSVDLSPVIKQRILQNHSVRKEERESRSFITHHEQAQLFAQFSVITLLCLFDSCEVSFQICFLCKGGTIDSGKHFVLLTASPVSACEAGQLECLDRLCAHKVRTCTKVNKLALLIKADLCVLRQILDQLYLVRLVFLLKICDCILS